jgi:ABC-type phosphate transport system ATPase subunit
LRLSGGQQQLVLIARALGASQNILLDEPCSALDLANQQLVLQLISDLAHRQKRTVLFTRTIRPTPCRWRTRPRCCCPTVNGWRENQPPC